MFLPGRNIIDEMSRPINLNNILIINHDVNAEHANIDLCADTTLIDKPQTVGYLGLTINFPMVSQK